MWLADHTGSMQVWAHDLTGNPPAARRVSEAPAGVSAARIRPDGQWIWWFADGHGNEIGRWTEVTFMPSDDVRIRNDIPVGRARGLVFGVDRIVAGVGIGATTSVVTVAVSPGSDAIARFDVKGDARIVALLPGAVVVARQEPTRVGWSTEVRTPDGALLHRLDDRGHGADPVATDDAGRIVVTVERDGFLTPATWVAGDTEVDVIGHGMPGDVVAATGPTAGEFVLTRTWRGRVDLSVGRPEAGFGHVDIPTGTVSSWAARPDGSIEVTWSSATMPPQRLVAGDEPLPGTRPASPIEELDVTGPGGPIRVQLSGGTGAGTAPTILLVHGGPAHADFDEWSPARAAWADAGYLVCQVDYRGSIGYGVDWRLANHGRPGETEVADLGAVVDHLVDRGIARPGRVGLVGRSWGGYLTLLALGMLPERWLFGIANVPVGDPSMAYEEMFEEIRGSYRDRFGGPPDEVPAAYRRASPRTYVSAIRVPVMVTAGRRDQRCPIAQIDAFVDDARAAGVDIDYHVAEGGHTDRSAVGQAEAFATQLEFARRHLTPRDA